MCLSTYVRLDNESTLDDTAVKQVPAPAFMLYDRPAAVPTTKAERPVIDW